MSTCYWILNILKLDTGEHKNHWNMFQEFFKKQKTIEKKCGREKKDKIKKKIYFVEKIIFSIQKLLASSTHKS